METNALPASDLGYNLYSAWGVHTVDFLDGAKQAIVDDGVPSSMLEFLGAILVALLVLGGLYWVVRRIIKAYRATR